MCGEADSSATSASAAQGGGEVAQAFLDLAHGRRAERPVQVSAYLRQPAARHRGTAGETVQNHVHRIAGVVGQGIADRVELVHGGMVRGQPRVQGVGGVEPVPGQPQVHADRAGQPRQKVAGPDVREVSDAGLGHRPHRALGDNPEAAADGQTETAAHAHAVDERHDRDGILGDPGVSQAHHE
ncbi:hypothetical protein WBG99_00810 [Streptomyces sp. TG1A-60]|uniref:hypothetical protein n=1 Tax=Streptomyces sp. TG1A-60 TaxID=3129111 RepID=UPI0030CED424